MPQRARRKPAPGCTCKTARHTAWMRQQRHRAEQTSAFAVLRGGGAMVAIRRLTVIFPGAGAATAGATADGTAPSGRAGGG
jgi:hypothetical protein